ncbi:hypothetical protein ACFT1A_22900 [Rhodococcus sp. NPDC057135]|uniref:hypothetical protein n=1 Tax=Rhodococcus sp. NPDC057135 TaxID=3346028 RepID=UPI00362A3BDB
MDAKSSVRSRQQIVQFARKHLRTEGPDSEQIRRHFGLQKRAFFTQLDTHLDDSALSMPEKVALRRICRQENRRCPIKRMNISAGQADPSRPMNDALPFPPPEPSRLTIESSQLR